MLDYMRRKLVNIVYDEGVFNAHGVLDDDIYSIEVDLVIDAEDLVIEQVKGTWHRYTTPCCPLAVDFLEETKGVIIRDGFADKIHRTVGRRSCRHFANLIIECCYSVKEALKVLDKKSGEKVSEVKDDKITKRDKKNQRYLSELLKKEGPKTLIDIHVHTSKRSRCSSAKIEDIISNAKKKGLDGICITDHNYMWDEKEIEEIRKEHNFLVLRGNEITTDQGDMLVFGMYENIDGIIDLESLRMKVTDTGGIIIAAHPFRGFLAFSGNDIGLTKEKASERDLFRYVDGVEILNGKVTDKENGLADEVADILNLSITGGSDVHLAKEVGKYATLFFCEIRDENDLIDAVREKKCTAVII